MITDFGINEAVPDGTQIFLLMWASLKALCDE